MNNDAMHMERCLALAKLGAGFVAPNPMVGAVLVTTCLSPTAFLAQVTALSMPSVTNVRGELSKT